MKNKIPVLILAFNRADHVERALEAVAQYKPNCLYLACDGPRAHKDGEAEAVMATREAMLKLVTWPCDVKTLFRDTNYGCAKGVNNAISWFFEQEEYGIIIEDDIVLGQDFFKLCEVLLPRYAKEDRIMQISARNTSFRTDIPNQYVYSQCFHCWGWATWRRAWERMSMEMKDYESLKTSFLIKRLGIFRGLMIKSKLQDTYQNLATSTSWAIRWYYSIICNDGLVICPGVNLAINIGMDGGEHFVKEDAKRPGAKLKIGQIAWPLQYNDSMIIDAKQKRMDSRFYFINRLYGLKKMIKKSLNMH